MSAVNETEVYGILAEFEEADELLAAARGVHEAGYRDVEAYTPFSVEGIDDYVRLPRRDWVPAIVLVGGIVGGTSAFMLQYFSMAISYPLNIGGRPLNSWPIFIPITFELTVLGAALFGAIGMLWLNGLPKLYHPVFLVPRFRAASTNRFFLCIQRSDPNFDEERTAELVESFDPVYMTVVMDKKR